MKKLLMTLLIAALVFTCFANGTNESKGSELTAVQAALKDAEDMTWDELLAKAKEEIGKHF